MMIKTKQCLKYLKYGVGILLIYMAYISILPNLPELNFKSDNPVRTRSVKRHKREPLSDNSTGPNPIFNGQYILNNISMCIQSEPVNVIVVVHTAPTHFLQRENIRETYGARKLFLPTEVRVIFLLGRLMDQKLQERIVSEHNAHGDIIQGDFKDAYHNLTYKAVMGLHWVSHYCPDTEYVIKTDDDVVFDMWRFMKQVYTKIRFISRTIYGIVRSKDSIPRSGKWTVPSYFLRGYSHYPFQFCIGFVLIMSADVIPDLYRATFKVPFFWLDDVYVTGLLPSCAGGIVIKQHFGNLALNPDSDALDCLKEKLYKCPYLAVCTKSLSTYWEVWNLFRQRNNVFMNQTNTMY
ncbi:hypothetical protein SNE40_018730 [Patella caerulea]|uniref:Hexosyltransferase n=1 Tax=Patella caerulea TaxID=87958 RepID=A0AAN8J5F6_PATCE